MLGSYLGWSNNGPSSLQLSVLRYKRWCRLSDQSRKRLPQPPDEENCCLWWWLSRYSPCAGQTTCQSAANGDNITLKWTLQHRGAFLLASWDGEEEDIQGIQGRPRCQIKIKFLSYGLRILQSRLTDIWERSYQSSKLEDLGRLVRESQLRFSVSMCSKKGKDRRRWCY